MAAGYNNGGGTGDSPLSEREEYAALGRLQAQFVERSRLVRRRAKKYLAAFIASGVLASLFLKGMPLHELFVPYGQALLVVCALIFGVLLCDVAVLLSDSLDRSSLNKHL